MEFELACATWVREADEKILDVLRASPRWLTPEELQTQTGLSPAQVEHTLRMLAQQIKMEKGRKRLLPDLVKDKE